MAQKDNPDDDKSAPRSRAGASRAEPGDVEDGSAAGDPLDSRLGDMESEPESQFLRARKRVPVRRGPLPKKAANRFKWGLVTLMAVTALALIAGGVSRYGRRSWRFRLDSSDQIQLLGNRNVSRAQVEEVFGSDISRNVFLIPLDERKRQLEQIPWIASATVMRLLPNRVRVEVRERVPVAYVQLDTEIKLVDGNGVVMDTPSQGHYSFPVILGFSTADTLSARAVRMRTYTTLIRELDSTGNNYSHDLNEVDLSDPDDVKITVTDPQGEVLVHLGSTGFLDRYQIFVTHVHEWRQQFQKLDSVDLRYERQVIVNPENRK